MRALHAQKLEALGLVAAKVAHDFNNVLAIVQGSADVLAARTDADFDGIDDIKSALRLGRDLVKNLLDFVRPTQASEAPSIDLGAVVAALMPAARRLAAGRIVIVDIARGEWRAQLDSADAERIVSNLVVNARSATTEGDEITLRVRGDSTETPPSVILEVSDNGTGMDAATQSRMFDPFFTTRADAGGTGLGLSTVHGIVHAARGTIDVESEVGRGTTIRIRLPLAP